MPVKRGLVAVEAHVQFDNKGMTRIDLHHANVKLQNVSDQPYGYGDLARQTGPAYWQANRPGKASDRQFREGELRWPVINQFDDDIDHLIEPGETDILVFTFLVPCQSLATDTSMKRHFIRVASDVTKPAGSGPKDFAWKARSFADLSTACGGKGNGK